MENLETTQPVGNQISLNNEMKEYLLETAKWGKFIAIVGYIGIGLLLFACIAMLAGASALSSLALAGFPIAALAIVYIVIAVLYYFPVTYLYRFSTQMKAGLNSGDQQNVTSATGNMKSLFKFMGIFTIVILSLYAVILLGVIVVLIIK